MGQNEQLVAWDWTAKDVASFLNVSNQTVYNMAKKKTIPSVRISSRYFFEQARIKEWLEKSKAGYEDSNAAVSA